MKKLFRKILIAGVVLGAAVFASCGKAAEKNSEAPQYDESKFIGSGIDGIPGLLDMVGYGNLYGSSYKYDKDGNVALTSNFFVPLRGARTEEGFSVSLSVAREDGVFDVMTEARNTGGICIKTENVFYRFFVVGVDDETSKIIVSGRQKRAYGNEYDYYERQYSVPLGNYCTGAPLNLKLSCLDEAYCVTLTASDGTSVFKKIDENTEYKTNPSYSSDCKELFESGVKILGLQSMEVRTKFSDVSFELGNAAAAEDFKEQKLNVSLDNAAPQGGELSVSEQNPAKGESVTVYVRPEEGWFIDVFTVNGINRKNALGAGAGNYEYEITGIQSNTAVKVVFGEGEEKKYTVTGTYAYTSGVYNEITGKYENDGDEVSVRAGVYTGTAENGRFSIELPDGEHTLMISSEKFPASQKKIVVYGEEADVGEIAFNRLNFTTAVSYNADDSLTFSGKQTVKLFDEVPADEGFVVEYTVTGGSGTWFDTGGLYMRNADGTFDYVFVFQSNRGRSSAKAQIVLIQSDIRRDNGPTLSTTYPYPSLLAPIHVTIAYYQGEFHIILDDVYACSINAATKLTETNGKINSDFFKAKPRQLGLRNYDSSATFSDIRYALGDAAALKVIKEKNVSVKMTAGVGGEAKLTLNGSEISSTSVQNIGAAMVVTITPKDGYVIDRFVVNGVDCKSLLQGPFVNGGKEIWKYAFKAVKGGVELTATFEEGEEKLYTVRGRYGYDALSENGVVTVKAGEKYMGTAADGEFEIALPKGRHILTLYDGAVYVTKEICVEGDTDAGTLTFSKISLQETVSGVSETNGTFTIGNTDGGFNFHPLTGPISASDGFVVSYTVTGTSSSAWFNTGAFYFEKNGVTYSVCILVSGGKARIGLQQPDVGIPHGCAYWLTEFEYEEIDKPLKVTIVYYKETFYIRLGEGENAYICELSMDTKLVYPAEITSEFFSSGYRMLGFRAMDATVTFENISYEIGNEKALEILQKVFGYENMK